MMTGLLLANGQGIAWQDGDIWYALVLIVAFSLVYTATRHERLAPILVHAGRVTVSITAFMLAVFAVLATIGWFCI
jgi:hypothetical protein